MGSDRSLLSDIVIFSVTSHFSQSGHLHEFSLHRPMSASVAFHYIHSLVTTVLSFSISQYNG
jgi:hypothetical protein